MSDPGKIATSNVPEFDGSNYKLWSEKLTGLFRYANIYTIVMGMEQAPKAVDPNKPTIEETKLINDWNNKNQRAIGYMQVYMSSTLTHHIHGETLASVIWTKLAGIFSATCNKLLLQ